MTAMSNPRKTAKRKRDRSKEYMAHSTNDRMKEARVRPAIQKLRMQFMAEFGQKGSDLWKASQEIGHRLIQILAGRGEGGLLGGAGLNFSA